MERLLNVEEVAEILNVSTAWVYDHADRKRPRIPCVRLGKAVRFRPEDVLAFIDHVTRRVA
jgi:excisionase family DNA binding protein